MEEPIIVYNTIFNEWLSKFQSLFELYHDIDMCAFACACVSMSVCLSACAHDVCFHHQAH